MDETAPDLRAGIAAAQCAEGGLLAGTVDGEAVVLLRHRGKLCALGGTCTHLGAPLAEGLVVDGELRCPWHHARFSVDSGEATGAPAFEPLRRYEVTEKDGRIVVGDAREPAAAPPPRTLARTPVVIVGVGAAGHACAEWLARHGAGDQVIVLGAEDDAPYDRTFCSKQYLAGTKSRAEAALPDLAKAGVDLRLGATVKAVHPHTREVELESGEVLGYGTLVLATGAAPVAADFEGGDHDAVHVLRTLADAEELIAALDGVGTAAVVGASFIGLEAAAGLVARGLAVTVVAPDALPLAGKMGEELGRFVKELHESRGVKFELGREVGSYDGARLKLDDGREVEAEVVVIGIGVEPRVTLAAEAGLTLASADSGGGVKVDAQLQTSVPGIHAIGDIAHHPDARLGKPIRVEHWVHAQRQGQFLARLLLGEGGSFTETPFFWSGHYDRSLRYVGKGSPKHRELRGSIADPVFAIEYADPDGNGEALLTCGRDVESLQREAAWDRQAASGPSSAPPQDAK